MDEVLFLSLSTTQEVPTRTIQANQTINNPLAVFNTILMEEETREGFSAFTEGLQAQLGIENWKDLVPFLELTSSRSLRSATMTGLLIDLTDFLKVGKPYFYSFDDEGNPFIAFVLSQKGKPIIKILFFSKELRDLPEAHKEQFTAMADLFATSSCFIDQGKGYVVWTLANMPEIEKAIEIKFASS